MWSTSYSARTPAGPAAVWAKLQALHTGTVLGPGSEVFQPHGPFALGTELTVTPPGGSPMTAVISELKPGSAYADTTVIGDLTLTFRHELTGLADGGTRITHTLQIAGPDAEGAGAELGTRISHDFAPAMAELIAAAERG